MSAEIITLRSARIDTSGAGAGRARDDVGLPPGLDGSPIRVQRWSGASGRSYLLAVHPLIGCPPQRDGLFVLVRPTSEGAFAVLFVGRTEKGVPSLNLARIRRLGSRLGAHEVHVLIGRKAHRARIERDIRDALAAPADAQERFSPDQGQVELLLK